MNLFSRICLQISLGCVALTGLFLSPFMGQGRAATGLPTVATPVVDQKFLLEQNAPLTSAGIYDLSNHLVRVLWTMKPLIEGEHSITWDGLDQFGKPAPDGQYMYKVAINGATYQNVGVIGNDGQPQNSFGHTPANMESVACDAQGGIYTANGWDEAGADFKKWDASGKPLYEANFQIRNGLPNGAPYSIATDDKYLYCGMGGWAGEPWHSRQQVQRFALADGKAAPYLVGEGIMDGHIQIMEWPQKQVPEGTPPEEAGVMSSPLRALVVNADSIFVCDALNGKIRRYDKTTGLAKGDFDVKFPIGLALDPQGRLWVGHEHSKISVFNPDGSGAADVLSNLGEIQALAFNTKGQLLVADSSANQVKIYTITDTTAALARTFGQAAKPGDRAADHFYHLRGVATDPKGNMVTIQTEPLGGARLARWSPDGKLLWEHWGTEFVSLGNYGPDQPDTFYSMSLHRYTLLDRKKGTSAYTGNLNPPTPVLRSDPHGVPRVLKFGKASFYYTPTGDGMQVYRIETNQMKLAAALGGSSPATDSTNGVQKQGQWTWSDKNGNGTIEADEVNWFKQPGEGGYSVFGMDVDGEGNIVMAMPGQGVFMVPRGKPDAVGNPTYDWAQQKKVIAPDTTPVALEMKMAQHAPDGSWYVYGPSKLYPAKPEEGGLWMGGNVLARYDKNGDRLWVVQMPAMCTGLDVLPNGGCITGTGWGANLLHYSPGGLLIGQIGPGAAMGKQSGAMDCHAAVAISKDPRDGLIDVFTEDDFVDRIGWYRIDTRKITALTGQFTKITTGDTSPAG